VNLEVTMQSSESFENSELYPQSSEYIQAPVTDRLITKDELYVGRILSLEERLNRLEEALIEQRTRFQVDSRRDRYQFWVLFVSVLMLFGSFLGIVLASGWLKLDAAPIAMAKDVLLLAAGIIAGAVNSYFKRD